MCLVSVTKICEGRVGSLWSIKAARVYAYIGGVIEEMKVYRRKKIQLSE